MNGTREKGTNRVLPGSLSPVLVIMDDYHLGDFVISLPIIEAFAKYFDEPIDLLVARQHAGLASLLPSASRINFMPFTQDKKHRTPGQGFRFLSLLFRLFWKRYRAVVVIRGGIRDATLTMATMSRRRIGLRESKRSRVYNHKVDGQSPPLHVFEKYSRLLECIGQHGVPPRVRLRTPESVDQQLESVLRDELEDPSARIAVIHPGAGYSFRCWPKERFAGVGDELIGKWNMDVFLIGSPKDQPFLDEIRGMMKGSRRCHLFTQTLELLLALFNRASILVSNESGPTHLASATDVPIVTVMGPTNESCWGPVRKENLLIMRGPKCDECSWKDCPHGVRCVTSIEVRDVLDAVGRLVPLSNHHPRPAETR